MEICLRHNMVFLISLEAYDFVCKLHVLKLVAMIAEVVSSNIEK